jgi:hypothetical protein
MKAVRCPRSPATGAICRRALSPLLVVQLAVGCTTLRAIDPVDMRRQMRSSDAPIALRARDGSTVRLDPNTEVRFYLRDGHVTRWVRGSELWHSAVGLSFAERKRAFIVHWEQLSAAEVRNLSSGKTAAAIAVSAVIVGLVVVAIIGSGKGGGGGSGIGSLGGSTGGLRVSRGSRAVRRAPVSVTRRRLVRRARGGVHVHLPWVALAATHHHHYHDAGGGPPPGSPPPPAPPNMAGAGDAAADERDPSGVPIEEPTGGDAAADMGQGAGAGEAVPAVRLFDRATQRRFMIQLIASAAGGTELYRLDRSSGSLYLGLRIRDAFELGGGVRHMLAPLPASRGGELAASVVGFGRIGAHLGLGVSKRAALAMSLDAGSGYRSRFQLKLNLGLRLHASDSLAIGLFPFSPTFNYYKESSLYEGALRWTFPTTLELAP